MNYSWSSHRGSSPKGPTHKTNVRSVLSYASETSRTNKKIEFGRNISALNEHIHCECQQDRYITGDLELVCGVDDRDGHGLELNQRWPMIATLFKKCWNQMWIFKNSTQLKQIACLFIAAWAFFQLSGGSKTNINNFKSLSFQNQLFSNYFPSTPFSPILNRLIVFNTFWEHFW
jgi:hypothetical protein